MGKTGLNRWVSGCVGWCLLGAMGVGCSGESPVVGRSEGDSSELGSRPPTAVTQFAELVRWGSADADDPLCLPFEPPLDSTGDASCSVIQVTFPEGPCECEAPAFVPAKPEQIATALELAYAIGCGEGTGKDCANYCACEAVKATGEDLRECVSEEEPSEDAYGWCYVSDERGNPELVRGCPPYDRQRLRALGPTNGDYLAVIECTGVTQEEPWPSGAVGDPCLPEDELSPDFGGFMLGHVSVDTQSATCDSGVCLVNNFQGRASCPYGQTDQELGSGACRVPGSDVPVSLPVAPQLVDRQAAKSVTCSCRCDGPGEGPFCQCPSGTECRPLIDDLGLAGSEEWAGSYCIPEGSEYDPQNPALPSTCSANEQNCGDAHPY